jgi:hypothetical protein
VERERGLAQELLRFIHACRAHAGPSYVHITRHALPRIAKMLICLHRALPRRLHGAPKPADR